MKENKSVLFLISIMIFVSLIVIGAATYFLYNAALDEEKARLVETAQSQARLIEAVARHDAKYHEDYPGDAEKATLSQIIDAHANYDGFGETGEFTLARRVGDQIIFLLSHRHHDLDYPLPVPFVSMLAEPMRRALSGMSGTVFGLDYRGEKVLAAYEPVGELHLGIVAKIDLSEIRAPFVRASLIALGTTVLAVILGALLFFRITNPIMKRLAESEELFRSLVEASPDGITLTDLDGKILMCNPQTVKLHGFESQEEIIGKSSLEFTAPENQQKAIENIERTLQNGKVRNVEYAQLKKDGTIFPGEVSASLIVDKEGKPKAFMAVTRDITEQKKAEKELFEKEQWLATTLRSIGDAVIATDPKGIVNFMNHVAEGLTGWDKANAVGKPLKDVFNIINEQTGEPAENPVARVIREGIVVGLANHTVLISKDGTKRAIADSGAPMKDEEENIIGVVMVFRDITERKKAEEEKENLHAQLVQSEKIAGIGTLTSGIAHEFNNLLQIMSGHAEYAQRTKKPEDMEEALDIVGNTSDRVSKIIKDLLTFSRREPLERKLCNIAELVEFVLSMTEEQLIKNNINVLREFRRVPKVEVSEGGIQQVLLNIVTNARDAMLLKGGKLDIGIKKVKDNIEISLTDTGIGIDEENLGRVFEPFYTTKGAIGGDSRTQGIGLGLSVSYGIVERHGGSIEVESDLPPVNVPPS